MTAGVHPRREREFKQLERNFKQEGRYPGCAQEA